MLQHEPKNIALKKGEKNERERERETHQNAQIQYHATQCRQIAN